MGGHGGSKSFSFSFGGSGGSGGASDSFDFGFGDIFSNLFGGNFKSGGKFGGSRSGPSKSIRTVSSQIYKTEIVGKGMTWLLLTYTPSLKGIENVESIVEDVAASLQGALKVTEFLCSLFSLFGKFGELLRILCTETLFFCCQVGSINCEIEQSLCKDLGIFPRRVPKVFVYSCQASEKGALVEFAGDLSVRDLKTFCQSHLPRFSKRVELKRLDFSSLTGEKLPTVMLLSTKKDTPVIWRVLSGLYHKRFNFYDAQVCGYWLTATYAISVVSFFLF